jgi:hypothetical protein
VEKGVSQEGPRHQNLQQPGDLVERTFLAAPFQTFSTG